MLQKVSIGVIMTSVVCIAGGYALLNGMQTRDFNFGPPFLIMLGVIGLVVGSVGTAVELYNHRSQ